MISYNNKALPRNSRVKNYLTKRALDIRYNNKLKIEHFITLNISKIYE